MHSDAVYELAQLNVATALEPLDSPVMSYFIDNLDRINGLAESSPGFVWRLKDDSGSAIALRPFDADTLVNLSVWRSVEELRDFAYRSVHVDFIRRREEWFRRLREPVVVLWWVPAGHRPSVEEAAARLRQLRAEGPSAAAFTFARLFPPPAPDQASPQHQITSDPGSRR